MKTLFQLGIATLGLMAFFAAPANAADRVVLELFTSQGCSSCPPADRLMKTLAENDPSVLVLSFHIHYWDNLGWKDPYSSVANTDRQKNYAALLHAKNIFTPQLIVDGHISVLGSDASAIAEALHDTRIDNPSHFDVRFTPDPAHHLLMVTLSPKAFADHHLPGDLFAIRYKKTGETDVGAGENSGQHSVQVNNVLDIKKVGSWTMETPTYQLPLDIPSDQGLAIIVQAPEQGKILAAASFEPEADSLSAALPR